MDSRVTFLRKNDSQLSEEEGQGQCCLTSNIIPHRGLDSHCTSREEISLDTKNKLHSSDLTGDAAQALAIQSATLSIDTAVNNATTPFNLRPRVMELEGKVRGNCTETANYSAVICIMP